LIYQPHNQKGHYEHVSWLRTIRPGIPPSELVVATALRQRMPQFLLDNSECNIFAKFILDRQDQDKIALFRMAA
jgi:hypothetical protein